ncbi:MAG: tRNA glutamyl-Q(34) synthetase GluQRS [Methylobacteriaceae bacterium]|nr:tRNA glutamyl-Q(34) synthetase GluQRS [Methylobacteriaceae bacterium]MBV9704148.1 tRNA glutamyl-Q(34) synthetase GluQRS [Methylobacteriaceae bacterium]
MAAPPTQPVFRFAPSPNGHLHLGHAYSALKNFELARRSNGRFLLRIEDVDLTRARPAYETAIYEDLAWIGLQWETPVWRQSEHFGDYELALDALRAQGCLYPCFCSRGDIARAIAGRPDWPRDPDGEPLYPRTCKQLSPAEVRQRLAAGRYASRRLDMDVALGLCGVRLGWEEYGEGNEAREVRAEPSSWGDAVLARKDVPASYTIAVVVDDARQGVTDVVRGRDLFAATSLHRLLQTLLGYPAPRYRHHALVRDEAGEKLSKSTAAEGLRALREAGVKPDEIRWRLGFR